MSKDHSYGMSGERLVMGGARTISSDEEGGPAPWAPYSTFARGSDKGVAKRANR
jgi:hypothetical protein